MAAADPAWPVRAAVRAFRRAHPELTDPHLDPVRVDHDADARTLVVMVREDDGGQGHGASHDQGGGQLQQTRMADFN